MGASGWEFILFIYEIVKLVELMRLAQNNHQWISIEVDIGPIQLEGDIMFETLAFMVLSLLILYRVKNMENKVWLKQITKILQVAT